MADFIVSKINNYLLNFDYKSALFYAQYFYDTDQSNYSIAILARCYISCSNFISAYILLKEKFDFYTVISHYSPSKTQKNKNMKNLIENFLKSSSKKTKRLLEFSSDENESPIRHKKNKSFKYNLNDKLNNKNEKNEKNEKNIFNEKDQKVFNDAVFYFGFCCLKLDKMDEGCDFFEKFLDSEFSDNFFGSREYKLAYDLFLRNISNKKALKFLEKAFKLDPYNWSVIENLCDSGIQPEINFMSIIDTKNKTKEILKKNIQLMAMALFYEKNYNDKKNENFLELLSQSLLWTKQHLALMLNQKFCYKESENFFKEIRKRYPYSFDYIEIYSTVLWQLRKKIEISFLVQILKANYGHKEKDPFFYVVLGNQFSLEGSHEDAIECFKKAIEKDKNYLYAHSVLGSEYAVMKDFKQAEFYFRNCVKLDPKSYKYWAQLGHISLKQAEFNVAIKYYEKAVRTYPNNHVLLAHLGIALYKNKMKKKALIIFEKIKGKNVLADYHRAKALFELGNLNKSLKILHDLNSSNNCEAPILILIAKIYKAKNNEAKSLEFFNAAVMIAEKKQRSDIENEMDVIMSSIDNEEFNYE